MVMRSCVRCGATIPQDEGRYWAGRFYCADDYAHDRGIARKVKAYVAPAYGRDECGREVASVVQPFAGLAHYRGMSRP